MTNGQDQGQPHGPWQPQRYDPAAHQRRISGAHEAPWRQAPNSPQEDPPPGQWQLGQSPQDYGQPKPPHARHRRRSRWPAYAAGLAALAVIAVGGVVFALKHVSSGPAKPLTCKQQYANWKTGPARSLATSFKGDGTALQSAAGSEDIPATDAALKKFGDDAARLEQYPMPACADPAGYWTKILAGVKAAGDNAGSTSGLAGLMAAMAPIQHVKSLEGKLDAELARSVGVKSAV